MADSDLEVRGGGGGGLDLLALLTFFPSVIPSFLPKRKGGRAPRAPPLDPPLYFMKRIKAGKRGKLSEENMFEKKYIRLDRKVVIVK